MRSMRFGATRSLANFEDTCHRRPISVAASRDDLEMVKLLLDHGADPNLPEEGAPRGHALWDAVYHERREMARVLVEHGADPNAMVESSGTPMLHARKDPEPSCALGGARRRRTSRAIASDSSRLIDDEDLAGVDRWLHGIPGARERRSRVLERRHFSPARRMAGAGRCSSC